MEVKKDNPGVHIPPPLFYITLFLISIVLQRFFPISTSFFENKWIGIIATIVIVFGVLFILPAFIKFLRSKNTIITVKPANSLQTSGIYTITRNPMYIGLLSFYTGIAFLKGNWWTFILIPLVIYVITRFVIIKEEKYLERAFGQEYLNYKAKVRRWL